MTFHISVHGYYSCSCSLVILVVIFYKIRWNYIKFADTPADKKTNGQTNQLTTNTNK